MEWENIINSKATQTKLDGGILSLKRDVLDTLT